MLHNTFYILYDSIEYTNFIKSVERQFRLSPEYSMWLNTVVTDRTTCGATGMSKEVDGVDIEVHHYITLWDWVVKILDAFHLHEPEVPVNSHYICLILADLHLNNCIPYIPLMHCVHKMIDKYGGNMEPLIEKYPSIIDNIHHGNMELADAIINEHVNALASMLNIE